MTIAPAITSMTRPRRLAPALMTLREAREQRCLTQAQLGALAHVHAFTVSRIETGQVVASLRVRRRLAEALQLDPSALLWSSRTEGELQP